MPRTHETFLPAPESTSPDVSVEDRKKIDNLKRKEITKHYNGKNVLVIGSSPENMGSAVVRGLLANDVGHVYVADIDEVGVSAFVEKLKKLGFDGRVTAIKIDVRDVNGMKAIMNRISENGSLDEVYNFAATFVGGLIEDAENIGAEAEVDYIGTLNSFEAALSVFMRQVESDRETEHPDKKKTKGKYRYVATSSLVDQIPFPGVPTYPSNKAAITMFGRTQRIELARRFPEIMMQVLRPGFVKTDATQRVRVIGGIPAEVFLATIPWAIAISTDKAALHILRGVVQGKYEVPFPGYVEFATTFARLFPNLVASLATRTLNALATWKEENANR